MIRPAPKKVSAEAIEGDRFMRLMIRDVAGVLQDVVGVEEAQGYISVVGDQMGNRLDDFYSQEHGIGPWPTEVLSEVLVDLKSRIGGTFSVVSSDDHRIVLENSVCPFGDAVLGRPALCMMTSNVFGRIGANHAGEVSVALLETIAAGDGRCVVEVRTGSAGASSPSARRYFAEAVEST